jgi:hypothetical protein
MTDQAVKSFWFLLFRLPRIHNLSQTISPKFFTFSLFLVVSRRTWVLFTRSNNSKVIPIRIIIASWYDLRRSESNKWFSKLILPKWYSNYKLRLHFLWYHMGWWKIFNKYRRSLEQLNFRKFGLKTILNEIKCLRRCQYLECFLVICGHWSMLIVFFFVIIVSLILLNSKTTSFSIVTIFHKHY